MKKGKTGVCCKPRRSKKQKLKILYLLLPLIGHCPYGQSVMMDFTSEHSTKCNLILDQSSCRESYECIAPYQGNPWGFCCSKNVTGGEDKKLFSDKQLRKHFRQLSDRYNPLHTSGKWSSANLYDWSDNL